MSQLATLLTQLEDVCRRKGAPAPSWLVPGVDPVLTRERLTGAGFEAPDEILDWYAWHNGSSSGLPAAGLAPTGWRPISFDEAFVGRAQAMETIEEVKPAWEWSPSWLPILWSAGGELRLADLSGRHGWVVPVIDFAWDSGPMPLAGSISELVSIWIDVLEKHAQWDPEKSVWDVRPEALPMELRRFL